MIGLPIHLPPGTSLSAHGACWVARITGPSGTITVSAHNLNWVVRQMWRETRRAVRSELERNLS